MKNSNFLKAVKIFSKQHSIEILINQVNTGGSVGDILENPTIHIKNSNASTVNNLIKAGFSLSMTKNGLLVEDYGVKDD